MDTQQTFFTDFTNSLDQILDEYKKKGWPKSMADEFARDFPSRMEWFIAEKVRSKKSQAAANEIKKALSAGQFMPYYSKQTAEYQQLLQSILSDFLSYIKSDKIEKEYWNIRNVKLRIGVFSILKWILLVPGFYLAYRTYNQFSWLFLTGSVICLLGGGFFSLAQYTFKRELEDIEMGVN